MRISSPLILAAGVLLFGSSFLHAAGSLGVGVWATYEYIDDNETDEETHGAIKDEALILYADGMAEPDAGRWLYSAELRIGPGSFTDTTNNSTGDQIALHKAWLGFQLTQTRTIRIGKSQVPFGWKTVNFWPGDILLAGYGDQMDVGLKLAEDRDRWRYDVAYYHADDWGERSTDTVDDNGHWGSSTTYRKVNTAVVNLEYDLTENHRLALAGQVGRLQDLTGLFTNDEVTGRHNAWAVSHYGTYGALYSKLSYIDNTRRLPRNHRIANGLTDDITNRRLAAELGYRRGNWFFYIDASWAEPESSGATADTVHAIAPGFSYDYGPGWVYVELLTQNGFVDRNGQVGEGDFDALYVSLDFYL